MNKACIASRFDAPVMLHTFLTPLRWGRPGGLLTLTDPDAIASGRPVPVVLSGTAFVVNYTSFLTTPQLYLYNLTNPLTHD
jgi:hypothetical protein